MSLAKKVAFNTVVQIGSKAITVIFGLLTTLLLTNYLGREGFGDYMYIITLAVLFGAFADWGTQTIGVREAAKKPAEQGRIFANIILLRLIFSLFAAGLIFVSASLLPLNSSQPVLLQKGIALGSLVVMLFALKASFGIIFQTKLQMQRLAVVDITASALTLIFTFALIGVRANLFWLVAALTLANGVALVIAWLLARKMVVLDFRLDRVFIKSFLKESLPMGAILLLFTVDNKIDTVMLGALRGSAAVGVYAVAYRMYDVLILGAAYLMNSLLPVFSKEVKKGRTLNHLPEFFQKTFVVLLFMGSAIFIFVLLFAPLMVRLVTGQSFASFSDSVIILRVLSVALFLAYFNHLVGYTLVAAGKQRSYFWISLGALLFNVTLNFFAIRKFSFLGAAIVTVLTEGLILFFAAILIRKKLGLKISLRKTGKNHSLIA